MSNNNGTPSDDHLLMDVSVQAQTLNLMNDLKREFNFTACHLPGNLI